MSHKLHCDRCMKEITAKTGPTNTLEVRRGSAMVVLDACDACHGEISEILKAQFVGVAERFDVVKVGGGGPSEPIKSYSGPERRSTAM